MFSRITLHLLFLAVSSVSAYAQTGSIDHWESVVYPYDTWHYFVGTNSGPSAGWQNPGFDDSAWSEGQGGFGYADGDDLTTITSTPNPGSVFIRTVFTITDTSQIAIAVLNMDYDDGFVAWMNGIEIARSNLGVPGDYPDFNTPTVVDHEAVMISGQNPPAFLIPKETLNSCLVNGNNTLAVQVNNMSNTSSDMSCIPFLSVGMITSGTSYRALPSWFVEPYTGFSGSLLPLIVIETIGQTIYSESKVLVDMEIIDNGPEELNQLLDDPNGYDGKIGIEYRGSSSMMFPKKNFGFETRTVTGADSAVSLLGLPVESDWVLHGPYSDKTLMRNFLAFDLARSMGHYAPRTKFCEMFIDKQYQGVYVLMEKIKRDTNRVDIAKLDTGDIAGYDLTGGYIIKIDRSADGSYRDGWFSPYDGMGNDNSGPFFAWHYPKWTEILPVQMTYIQNRVTSFEEALFGSQYRDPYIGYRNYIDVNSFIDYFILVELGKNTDGYRLSTFLYKDRDDKDRLIHMGPAWDYDLAFGNADYYEAFNTNGWNYTLPSDGWGTPFWWSKLISDPFFANQLQCRWHSLRQDLLSDVSMTSIIDTYVGTIGAASDRNFYQWPIHGIYIWPNPFVGNSYTEDVFYMKNWILDRMTWMDNNMPGQCTVANEDHPDKNSFIVMAKPNPSIGQINLEIQNPLEQKLRIEVAGLTGRLVYNELVEKDIWLSRNIPLQPGIYVVKVTGSDEIKTLKVIVQ